jgi:hypothetical protein
MDTKSSSNSSKKIGDDHSWVKKCDKVSLTISGGAISLHIPQYINLLHITYLTYLEYTEQLSGDDPIGVFMHAFPDLEKWEAVRIFAIYVLFSSHKLLKGVTPDKPLTCF